MQYDNAIGLLTGTRIYNLSEDGCYTAYSYYYDVKGRVIQNRSMQNNTRGYYTATSTEYLFDGSVAQQLTEQGRGNYLVREHYRYTYDHAGRLLNTFYQLNEDDEILLSAFSYDSIGRLVQNLLYNEQDTIRYSFDIRNMLTETRHKYYNEQLFYADNINQGGITPCYNGNISAIGEDGSLRGYGYDNMNRLTEEFAFKELFNYGIVKTPLEEFSYDEVGNLLSLKRGGYDDLTFYYGNDGNQLLSITENGQDADLYDVIEFTDRSSETDNPLLYDANGNLVKDAYRHISKIKYNILNLPDTIQFSNGHQIVNLYDASGRKYRTVNYTNLRTVNMDYNDIAYYTYNTDSVEYQVTEYLGNIMKIRTKEDSVITDKQKIFNTTGYYTDGRYYHYVKNHLGSICLVLDSEADSIVQSTYYSASGIPFSNNLDEQPYLYNGKEFVEAHGWNTYDYGFRGYYAPIGRFTSIDPLAEQCPWQSPYAYAGNNFVNNIDWMGLAKLNPHKSQWIATDDEGVVIDSDLTSPDKGIYRVNRETYERYTKNITNSNSRLLWLKTFGTQIGIHRDGLQGTILRGMKLDISWFNFSTKKHTSKDPTAEDEIYPMEMSQEDYLRMLYLQSLVHQGVIQPQDYMQYYNSFERGMITNPAIQSAAVGGAGVMALEGISLLYYIFQNSSLLQFGVGLIEGYEKGHSGAGPDAPFLYESLVYQVGSNLGSWVYEKTHK